MRLLKFHIIGHPNFEKSSWIDIGEGINILAPATTSQAQAFLHVLQALHPPYDCQRVHPFESFPLYRRVNSVNRKIISAKRTAVIAIYTASAELIAQLAAIDPLYWEVDRIEIGRRRDYTRWMSFVEIPASGRFSEVAKILHPLLAILPAERAKEFEELGEILTAWPGTDRLKGERAEWLRVQINRLQALLPHTQLGHCLQTLALEEHFRQAKNLVFANLPLFLNLPCGESFPSNSGQLSFLADRLAEGIADKAALYDQVEAINAQWKALGVPVFLLPTPQSIQVMTDPTRLSGDSSMYNVTDRTLRMLQCTSILHRAVYGTDPVVLFDFKQFCKRGHRCENPIALLRQLCGRFQCLIVPDEKLLDLCRKTDRAHLVRTDQMRIVRI